MPTLTWLTREEDLFIAQKAPYRLLEEDSELSYGDTDSENMLIHGDNLDALKSLLPYLRIPTNSSTHSNGNRPLIPRQFVHLSERSDTGGFFLLEVDELVNVGGLFSH